MLPITKNLLIVLEENKILRLKKDSKNFDKVCNDIKQNINEKVKVLLSEDNSDIIFMYDINYKIKSFLI
jgi:predicted component of type VI protein secretion system